MLRCQKHHPDFIHFVGDGLAPTARRDELEQFFRTVQRHTFFLDFYILVPGAEFNSKDWFHGRSHLVDRDSGRA